MPKFLGEGRAGAGMERVREKNFLL